jgi:hypothetical protein
LVDALAEEYKANDFALYPILHYYEELFDKKCPVCVGGETVDTPALGAGAARHGGSSPLPRTVNSF